MALMLTLCGVLVSADCVLVGAHDMLCGGAGADRASSGTRTLDSSFAAPARLAMPFVVACVCLWCLPLSVDGVDADALWCARVCGLCACRCP